MPTPKPEPRALTAAERQQRRRQKGKVVSGVLTDPGAIAELARRQAQGLTCMRTIELGLLALAQSRKAS